MTAETNGHSPRSGSVQEAAGLNYPLAGPRVVHAGLVQPAGGAAPQAPDVAAAAAITASAAEKASALFGAASGTKASALLGA
eukprot:CAMPEP_0168445960 /NCGR_PEP_ID=MMETSP0228-20121227/45831_1 /TAXON_ID=133427 /ORGANISM="Protoceratium reticulatum, Strain CCCM 535 (=CCMP 1889)" /LENGTH=81 /DNA_ID=CAMNT_0008460445 /DNA_START=40 /DNA_END=282 /DNA_ORIENTATION=+